MRAQQNVGVGVEAVNDRTGVGGVRVRDAFANWCGTRFWKGNCFVLSSCCESMLTAISVHRSFGDACFDSIGSQDACVAFLGWREQLYIHVEGFTCEQPLRRELKYLSNPGGCLFWCGAL